MEEGCWGVVRLQLMCFLKMADGCGEVNKCVAFGANTSCGASLVGVDRFTHTHTWTLKPTILLWEVMKRHVAVLFLLFYCYYLCCSS